MTLVDSIFVAMIFALAIFIFGAVLFQGKFSYFRLILNTFYFKCYKLFFKCYIKGIIKRKE